MMRSLRAANYFYYYFYFTGFIDKVFLNFAANRALPN